MITILDYGSGNLKSIKNGFSKIGTDSKVTSSIKEIKDADALVLPGVGAFGNAMKSVAAYKDVVQEHVDDHKPFLGVCLGLQILFTNSAESPDVLGLDLIKGRVLHFPDSIRKNGLKIPQMGWNKLEIRNKCSILKDIGPEFMYFVHSYYVVPEDSTVIAATVDYGIDVPAVVCKDNIYATQFHPEKSGDKGLEILKNFVDLI